jgi:acyl dehydratase
MTKPVASRGKPIYLEDLAVGQRFTTASHALDEEQIKAFAAAYDPQPFHLDREAAKLSIFGDLVASGWHTAAITMRLLVETGLPLAGGLIGVEGSLRWPRPARPGDVLTVTAEVTGLKPSRSRPELGTAEIKAETRNQAGDVLQVFTATLVVQRKPS